MPSLLPTVFGGSSFGGGLWPGSTVRPLSTAPTVGQPASTGWNPPGWLDTAADIGQWVLGQVRDVRSSPPAPSQVPQTGVPYGWPVLYPTGTQPQPQPVYATAAGALDSNTLTIFAVVGLALVALLVLWD